MSDMTLVEMIESASAQDVDGINEKLKVVRAKIDGLQKEAKSLAALRFVLCRRLGIAVSDEDRVKKTKGKPGLNSLAREIIETVKGGEQQSIADIAARLGRTVSGVKLAISKSDYALKISDDGIVSLVG